MNDGEAGSAGIGKRLRFKLFRVKFGSITGTVRDAAVANVPNATIEETHVKSNYKYTAQSNEEGNYTPASVARGGVPPPRQCHRLPGIGGLGLRPSKSLAAQLS